MDNLNAPFSPPSDFDLEDTNTLERDGSFLTPVAGSKRTVSIAALSPPSSQSSPHSSSSPSSTASVRLGGFLRSPNSISGSTTVLPLAAISPAALHFIGFNEHTANAIYSRFISRPDPVQNPDELLDYVYGQIRSRDPREDLNPVQAMTLMGLTQRFQDAILNPTFTDIFGTESLYYWVTESLRVNYLTLLILHSRLKTSAIRSRAQKKIELDNQLSLAQPNATPEISATVMTTERLDESFPVTYIAVERAPPILPGHQVLWKARAVCDIVGWITTDGSLDMGAISTHAGGDFNHLALAWYWTHEFETAEKYRAWAALRCPWAETCMVRIQVPIYFLDSLRHENLWFGVSWKEYVWRCKKKDLNMPEKYDKFWKAGEADIVTGHICTSATPRVTRIKAENIHTHITEDFVLKRASGAKSTQVVFMQPSSVVQLATVIRGKIHIDVTAPLDIQSQA